MTQESTSEELRRDKRIKKAKPKKNPLKPVQKYRAAVQIGFSLICIWIGVEFYLFLKYLETGGAEGIAYRPPGVEGFLPISSLMSLYHFFITGEIHWSHPAGVFILIGAIIMSFVFGKSFCSWICPIGTISEYLGDLGRKIFRRKIKLPGWLDYPLRSLKYLLLGFFVYSIFFLMTAASLRAFLDSPYNIVADLKMYYFFADISRFSLIVISVLFFLSIPIRGFWCRFLCPYGALLGITSLLSPLKIRRNTDTCIDCAKCAKVCPSFIKVDKVETVVSDECTSCLNCIDICPIADTMQLRPVRSKFSIKPKIAAASIVGLFLLIIGLGMITGNWQNKLTIDEYEYHLKNMNSYGHPTGTREIKKLNDDVLGKKQ